MARARRRLLVPDPPRKIDCQTRFSRRLARYVSTDLAISGSHKPLLFKRRGAIHEKIAFVADRRIKPHQGPRRRSFDLAAIAIEFAAMAGAGDNPQFRFPGSQATQMSAHRGHRVNSLGSVDNVDARLRILRQAAGRVAIRLPCVGYGEWFIKHVRRQELIAEYRRAGASDANGSHADFDERFAPRQADIVRMGFVFSRFFLRAHLASALLIRPPPAASSTPRIEYASMVIVPTGHRSAQSPQRIQRVSSFSIAEPVICPNSSGATSPSSTRNSDG